MPAEQRAEPAEALRFDLEDALARLKDHSAEHYAGLYNVMKGVTLAAAGLALVRLQTNGYTAERIPLLIVGLLAIIVTYNGALIGQTIVHLRTSWVDVTLPMVLTVAEFVLIGFAVTGRPKEPMPESWLIALAAWEILAALVVCFVARRLKPSRYTTLIWPTVRQYRASQWVDACAAGVTGIATLGFWGARSTRFFEGSLADHIFVALTIVSLVGALIHHEQTRRQLELSLAET
jgi:hypothetical protein